MIAYLIGGFIIGAVVGVAIVIAFLVRGMNRMNW